MNSAPDVFSPAKLGPITLRNRTIKSATFEARRPTTSSPTTDQLPPGVAAGGVGMTTVAYCAVSKGGGPTAARSGCARRPSPVCNGSPTPSTPRARRSAPDRPCRPGGELALEQGPGPAPVRFFNPLAMKFAKHADRDDINDVIAAHAAAARFAIDAGFDAVEIHLGHNYLASSFLSPLVNRRTDEFGGSLENRAKGGPRRRAGGAPRGGAAGSAPIAVTIAEHVRRRAGRHLRRGGAADRQVAAGRRRAGRAGADRGQLAAQPDVPVRGDAPLRSSPRPRSPRSAGAYRMTGNKFLREYPYQDAYLLRARDAMRFRKELTLPLILLGGVTNRETMDRAMADGFEFVAMGRALLAEPDLLNRIQPTAMRIR